MKTITRTLAILAALSLLAFTACDSDDSAPVAGDTGGGTTDTVTPPEDSGGGGEDFTWLTIVVDSTGNECYGDEDIEWKGSFAYDAATNMITVDSAWGGPYPPLYDDGPVPDGHEAPGQVAGDHILSVAVKFANPAEETTLEYGMQTADGGWIWTGDGNGTVVVPAGGSADPIEATGMTIPAAGDIDVKLVIDTAALDANFPFTAGTTTIELKGTFTDWDAKMKTLADDGLLGDEAADDGLFTYVLSEQAEGCAGLLAAASSQEFVYQVGGVEYKDGNGDAIPTGVQVWTMAPGADWVEETVEMIQGGMGGMNTGFVVGE